MTSADAQPRDAAPSKPSIIAHPWFPKLIGLWCAALFGLCTLALAPAMLERIVETLGIGRIAPAAAPPLGHTARLLLASGMAGIGEIAGLLIGGWIAAGRKRRRSAGAVTSQANLAETAPILRHRDRHPDAPARKPVSAVTDLAETTSNEALGATETAGRHPAPIGETAHEPEEPAALAQPDSRPELPDSPADAQDEAAEPDLVTTALLAPPADAPSANGAAAAGLATASLDELGVVQLSERLALALQARRERRAHGSVAALDRPPIGPDIQRPEAAPGRSARTSGAVMSRFTALANAPFARPGTPAAGAQASVADAAALAEPDDTGHALRTALESLQRISGTR